MKNILIELDLQTAITIKDALINRIDNISRLSDLYKKFPELQEHYNKQLTIVNNIVNQIDDKFFNN